MKAVKYGAVLIGLYLAVVYFDGTSSDTKAASSGLSSVIAAFQGR